MSNSPRTESKLANLRDLGGIPLMTGHVRAEVLFRSDDLSLSPRSEIVDLVDRGLRQVLDLRSPTEKSLRPHRYLDGLNVAYHQLSFDDDAMDPHTAASRLTEIKTASDLGRWYARLTTDVAADIVRGLDLIAQSTGGVIFHCAAGKDRAGIFAAAVLSVLGADKDVIVEDYARTDINITNVLARLARASQEEQGGSAFQGWTIDMIDLESPLLRAYGDAAHTMLVELEEQYGGMIRLLRSAGLSESTECNLLERLIC